MSDIMPELDRLISIAWQFDSGTGNEMLELIDVVEAKIASLVVRLARIERTLADEDLVWEVVERYEECNPNEVIGGYRTAIQDLLEGIE